MAIAQQTVKSRGNSGHLAIRMMKR